jgi:hypothetical protein
VGSGTRPVQTQLLIINFKQNIVKEMPHAYVPLTRIANLELQISLRTQKQFQNGSLILYTESI